MNTSQKSGNTQENGENRPAKKTNSTVFFCDTALGLERLRTAAKIRQSHLKLNGRTDPNTDEFLKRAKSLTDFVDTKLKAAVDEHPTAKWWSHVKGAHRLTMGKILGLIESFGRWYPAGDEMIPGDVTREAITDEDNNQWVWVEGIERLTTPSKLFTYAGLAPDSKRVTGKLSNFNTELKTICFRLMQFGLMYSTGKYYDFYINYKKTKRARLLAGGKKIIPAPKGRFCLQCGEEKKVPRTTFHCPDCGAKLGTKTEPEGVVYEGHLDMMARRRTTKLFLTHLWVVWRTELGLSVRQPYATEYLGHTTINDPYEMCEDEEADSGETEETSAEPAE